MRFTRFSHPATLLLGALLAACTTELEESSNVLYSTAAFMPAASLQELTADAQPEADRTTPGASRVPPQIRGIYLTAYTAAAPDRLRALLELAARTEINAFVVDVKTENGVHYQSDVPLARETSRPGHVVFPSLRELVGTLDAHGLYSIARIVVFKDPPAVSARPEWTIRRPDGSLWLDREGNRWVSPWHPEVWDYNIALAEEAARAGFREIQFDYVRFPEAYSSLPRQIHPAAPADADRTDAIARFLTEARRRLQPLGVTVTADVFGMSMNEAGDVGIGQQWERLALIADHLLPMVYPSHYFSTHLPGISRPNRMPRETIETAVGMGVIRNERLVAEGGTPARIIPWLQAFDAPWVDRDFRYGVEQARAQIEGVYEVGLEDWIFWHPGSAYSHLEEAFEATLASRARSYLPPESLVRRMDSYDGWGMRDSRRRALAECAALQHEPVHGAARCGPTVAADVR
jgi:hypothetical protein